MAIPPSPSDRGNNSYFSLTWVDERSRWVYIAGERPVESFALPLLNLKIGGNDGNFGALQIDKCDGKWLSGHVIEQDGSIDSNEKL